MKHIITSTVMFAACLCHAQSGSDAPLTASALEAAVSSDLQALNTHYSGLVTFKIDKRDQLVASYISNGIVYRTDEAYIEFLDAAASTFVPEENTLSVQCQDPRSKCIQKEIHKARTISPTGRMNLPVPASDPNGTRSRELISRLIEHKQGAELQQLAETNTRGGR